MSNKAEDFDPCAKHPIVSAADLTPEFLETLVQADGEVPDERSAWVVAQEARAEWRDIVRSLVYVTAP